MGTTVASTTVVWPHGVEQYHGAAVAAGGDRHTHPRPQAAIAAQGFELPAIGGSPGQTAPGGADQQQGGDRLGSSVRRRQAHDRPDR